MENKIKILVTGSSGFVGSHLVKELLRKDFSVSEVDISTGINLTTIGSLKDVKKVDIVIHLAAKIFSPEAFINPLDYYFNNINSTLNVLEFCRENGSKLIFASSYVYGIPEYLPVDEEHPVSHFNPYASSKIICENLCKGYYDNFGVRVIILRPSNIFGYGQDKKFLIPSIMSQLKNGVVYLGNSMPKRDFVYIDDLVNAYIKAIEYNVENFNIFNIAMGVSYSVSEIISIIKDLLPFDFRVIYSGEKRKNEILDTVENIQKARKFLKWNPEVNLISGIKKMLVNNNII
jgi:UDP-glucose 4-epimerase